MSVSHHIVAPGDSWYRIANTVGVTPQALAAANGETIATMLHPGRILWYVAPDASVSQPPPPPPTRDLVYDTFGLRVPHPLVPNAADYIAELGRVPAFFRNVIDHSDDDGASMFDRATGSAWAYWREGAHPDMGVAHRWPTMGSSTIFPGLTEPVGTNLTSAQRSARHREVLAGQWDTKFTAILDYVAEGPDHVHRFCLNSEPDVSSFAYAKHGIDPVLWAEAFEYVAAIIRSRGHLVVYAHNGPMFADAPNGRPWWEYALPDLASFDIFANDCYISADNGPTKRLGQIETVAQIARDLDKKVAFPEYGVRQGTYGDADAVGFLREAWARMETFDHLDHHIPWNDNDARQTPAMRAAVIERFAIT